MADPGTLPFGTVDPNEPGARWWMYRRPDPPMLPGPPGASPAPSQPKDVLGAPLTPPPDPDPATTTATDGAGAMYGVLAVVAAVVVLISSRFDAPVVGRIGVPAVGILAALAFGKRLGRLHPTEPWLPRMLYWGVVVKLGASLARYFTLVDSYQSAGDATDYDEWGRGFAAFWLGRGPEPPELLDLKKTNFVRHFTGIVYYFVGADMIAGFFTFGLLALLGSYLWYRAGVMAVPGINRKLFLGLMMFAPSIAFWPSSIGKEALMQLGIGVMTLGVAHVLDQRLVRGLMIAAAGGWLVWVVRAHLLAIVTVAGAAAYFMGRTRRGRDDDQISLNRPIGMVILALLVSFTVSAGAEFLGIEELSVSSIEAELNETTAQTSQGGSEFESGGASLTPLSPILGAVTVLMRPFPWEVETGNQILASLESLAIVVFILSRLSSVTLSLTRLRATPMLTFAWILLAIYCTAFASFANFGLLVRQRSLVFPALFLILCVEKVWLERARAEDRARMMPHAPVFG